MDGQRFDALVRGLGGGPSRRTLLAGLAGATLGGILGPLGGGVGRAARGGKDGRRRQRTRGGKGRAQALRAEGAAAQDEPVAFGDSDAERIVLLHAYYPGYWWDHTDLTVAVQAAPNVDPAMVGAIRDAIATWSAVLAEQFPVVSLTDVTDSARNPHRADIVVHYVPDAGGVVWGGRAQCGDHKCNNVTVRSDVPDLIDVGEPDYDPLRVFRIALHELGHALGLGHAEPLEETTDLMGYGWSVPEPDVTPVLSTCDLAALAVVFAWAVEGADPYPAAATEVVC